jgi:hypothetical protein
LLSFLQFYKPSLAALVVPLLNVDNGLAHRQRDIPWSGAELSRLAKEGQSGQRRDHEQRSGQKKAAQGRRHANSYSTV